jgi:hypothetical protein
MRWIALVTVAALTSLVFARSAAASTTTSTVTGTRTIDFILPSLCSGEQIEVLGEYRFVAHITESANGQTIELNHFTSAGATGTGLTSGDTYQVVDVFTFLDDLSGAPYAATLTLRQQFISRGAGNSFFLFLTEHFTIDANGEGHALVGNVEIECR